MLRGTEVTYRRRGTKSRPTASPSAAPLTPPRSTLTASRSLASPLTCARKGVGDLAAGPRRKISLSEPEALPRFCCLLPGVTLIGVYTLLALSSVLSPTTFHIVTAVFNVIMALWVCNLAFSSICGAYHLRQGSQVDWHARLQQLQVEKPEDSEVMHIVLLPNYKEPMSLLKETLENIAASPMAVDRIRVVLAMEAREGPAGVQKAESLIAQTKHLFADIFATYHPDGLPGEVSGKSSNTQWAFREALRHYGALLQGCDLSRVILTVGDADTLWHPQYWSAVACNALSMAPEERAWRIWQPPVLLLRNWMSVPGLIRATAGATLVFELSSLANQAFLPALCFSSYSLSLELATHPEVDGWDVDVIAEDHHMFCKCYFAPLWELTTKDSSKVGQDALVEPKVRLEPVFLPAVSYLVESSDGYLASLAARFKQARRHSQGIVELGYVVLQYIRLSLKAGFFGLPMRTHTSILTIAFKMFTLHVVATGQTVALILTVLTNLIPAIFEWLWQGGAVALLADSSGVLTQCASWWNAMGSTQQVMVASLSPMTPLMALYTFTIGLVVMELLEGTYYGVIHEAARKAVPPPLLEGEDEASPSSASEEDSIEDSPYNHDGAISGTESPVDLLQLPSPKGVHHTFVEGTMSIFRRLYVFWLCFHDTAIIGYTALVTYGAIPEMLAAISTIRHGTKFEYVVALKPH